MSRDIQAEPLLQSCVTEAGDTPIRRANSARDRPWLRKPLGELHAPKT